MKVSTPTYFPLFSNIVWDVYFEFLFVSLCPQVKYYIHEANGIHEKPSVCAIMVVRDKW